MLEDRRWRGGEGASSSIRNRVLEYILGKSVMEKFDNVCVTTQRNGYGKD